jgi:hypothetical protein
MGKLLKICNVNLALKDFIHLTTTQPNAKKCIENSICLGKNNIQVLPGYWRETKYSEKILSCLIFESCLGGINSSCAEGY